MNLNTLTGDIKNNIKNYTIFKPKTKRELQKAVMVTYQIGIHL